MTTLHLAHIDSWRNRRPAKAAARGITLVELIVFVMLLIGVVIGAATGYKHMGGPNSWWSVGGLVVGAIVGGGAVIAGIFLLLLPGELYAAIRRVRHPADLVCRCNEPGRVIDEHLLPMTPLSHEAVTQSRQWSEWALVARLHLDRAPVTDKLQSRLNAGTLKQEQLAIAATLGEPAAAALSRPLASPLVHYQHWIKLPGDLQLALRSGLPPRLCLVWAMTCAGRALAVFENEFHLDTRPRQYLGLGSMALRGDSSENVAALQEEWERVRWLHWKQKSRGCRVLHRSFWQQFRGDKSPGEFASDALFSFAADVIALLDPIRLWQVHPRGEMSRAYETAHNRCVWSLPSFRAEDIAFKASRAFASPGEEFARQRSDLARMILGWEYWDEDREAWRQLVENEWIPKIESAAPGLNFDVPAYIAELRRTHLPWMAAASR